VQKDKKVEWKQSRYKAYKLPFPVNWNKVPLEAGFTKELEDTDEFVSNAWPLPRLKTTLPECTSNLFYKAISILFDGKF
jgi:hypothetical protein